MNRIGCCEWCAHSEAADFLYRSVKLAKSLGEWYIFLNEFDNRYCQQRFPECNECKCTSRRSTVLLLSLLCKLKVIK